MARQGWNDAPQTLLSIEEIQELCPVINTSKVKQIRMSYSYRNLILFIFHKNLKILAGLYTPGDGYIDPYSLTQGIATGLVATYIFSSFLPRPSEEAITLLSQKIDIY